MWQQVYDPLHSTVLSALVAAAPIILFLLSLTVFKLTGIKSALLSLAAALGIGIFVFGLPVSAGAGSILYGFLAGMWPIGWIVLMAVWLYRISVRAGNFDIVRSSVSAISTDQRIQMLLIAFCFGGFLEWGRRVWYSHCHCGGATGEPGLQPAQSLHVRTYR